MAEVAGLVLGALSLSDLFSKCIEVFNIVIAAKDFSEEFEQLGALFSLQRFRLRLWGESVGLIPNPHNKTRLQYNKNIDRADIQPEVERILNNIRSLLNEATQVNERYQIPDSLPTSELSISRSNAIFNSSFERFKVRIRKHQKDTSTWRVARWAIHDGKRFKNTIDKLEKFVDGLECITNSLGLLAEQHPRQQEEIVTISDISDISSVKLLSDAPSGQDCICRDASDTPSQRGTRRHVTKSFIEQASVSRGTSFITAYSSPLTDGASLRSDAVNVPGAWPRSVKSGSDRDRVVGHSIEEARSMPLGARAVACLMTTDADGIASYISSSVSVASNTFEESLLDEASSDQEYFIPIHNFPGGGIRQGFEYQTSNPSNFANFFPSTRRLSVLHDDISYDGYMNLRIDTEVTTGAGKWVCQLFHMRMFSLKAREFSLRRYERSSKREVCRSRRTYTTERPVLQRIKGGAFNSLRSTIGLDVTSPSRSPIIMERPSSYKKTGERDGEDEVDSKTSSMMAKASSQQRSTNTIRLEFSNYALVDLVRKQTQSQTRYQYEYWGNVYIWRRIQSKEGIAYHLYRKDRHDLAVAHIIPKLRSPSQIREAEASWAWIPPHSMWISDSSILDTNTGVPDVVISTGLIVLIDDCLHSRFKQTRRVRLDTKLKQKSALRAAEAA